MTSITITQTIHLSDETITEICETAGFGISYWADEALVDEENRLYSVHEVGDGDEDTTHNIPFDNIAGALQALIQAEGFDLGGGGSVIDFEVDNVDTGAIDSDVADRIVQTALFGKLVYG